MPLGEGVCLIAQTPRCSSRLLFFKQLSADGVVRVWQELFQAVSRGLQCSPLVFHLHPLCFSAILFLHTLSPPTSILNDTFFLKFESESEIAQSCPTLCDPMDCSPPGSSVHGIPQARILEWVAISLFRGFSRPRDRTRVSGIAGRRFTVSHQGNP